jgi:hypothetical protein
MRPMAKNYPFIHKTYMLCVLYVLRSEFLQWTHSYKRSTLPVTSGIQALQADTDDADIPSPCAAC